MRTFQQTKDGIEVKTIETYPSPPKGYVCIGFGNKKNPLKDQFNGGESFEGYYFNVSKQEWWFHPHSCDGTSQDILYAVPIDSDIAINAGVGIKDIPEGWEYLGKYHEMTVKNNSEYDYQWYEPDDESWKSQSSYPSLVNGVHYIRKKKEPETIQINVTPSMLEQIKVLNPEHNF